MDPQILVALLGLVQTLGGIWLTHHLSSNRTPIQSTKGHSNHSTRSDVLNQLEVGKVIRDSGIILLFQFFVGVVIGIGASSGDLDDVTVAIAIFNLISLPIIFGVLASLKPPSIRWKHISLVAVIIWISGIAGVITGFSDIGAWVSSALFILIMMGIGGAASYLIRR